MRLTPLSRNRPAATPVMRAMLVAIATLAAAAPAAHATIKTSSLEPLARGQLQLSLGTPPQWLPVSGTPLTATLFSGAAKIHSTTAAAFLAFQRSSKRCAATPDADKETLHEIPDYYVSAHLLSRQSSPFAPNGGTTPGTYAASVGDVVIDVRGSSARACIWMTADVKSKRRDLVSSATVPLLNATFAASVSDLPQYNGSTLVNTGAYTVNAIAGGRSVTTRAVTTECGTTTTDTQTAAAGEPATETIALAATPCAGDHTKFGFSGGFGSLNYTALEAQLTPPAVARTGGCELDPVTGTSVPLAVDYVLADGCSVGQILVSPYRAGIARGAVIEAEVDGGVAELAPRSTKVALVTNGRG